MKVSDIARSKVGHPWPPDDPDTAVNESKVPEQCMNFVRACLREAGHPLAGKVTAQAVDELSTSAGLASSLAGRDLGFPMVGPEGRDQLAPGAILFWANTYGTWAAGTITHVGIYVGNGQFVHRPTMDRAVELASLSGFWATQFRAALLSPDQVEAAPAPAPAKPPSNTHPVELLSVEFVVRTAEGKVLKLFHNARGTNLVGEM